MIHPSTMAGANWTTGNFGTTNPFQQSSMPFLRTMPFPGPQASYGPGINPLQNQPFGTNTMQMQNTINEIVRQTVPRVLASTGILSPTGLPPQFGLQPPIGQQGQFGFQTPFAFQSPAQFGSLFQSTPWMTPGTVQGDWQSWQTQNPLQEVIRLATLQAVQNLYQQSPHLLSQGLSIQNQPFQGLQSPYGGIGQQQNLMNLVGQVCQAVTSSVIECLAQPNQMQNMLYSLGSVPFGTQQTPFYPQQTPFYPQQSPLNISSTQPQYGVTPGIPVGAGAF